MSWLKRQQPLRLYQFSDVPHVITEEGLKLCFDNCYSELREENATSFLASKKALKRLSTHYYKFNQFPIVIPLNDVIAVPGAIHNGQIIKTASSMDSVKRTAIVKSSYIEKLSYKKFNKFVRKFDKLRTFILTGETISPPVRALEDITDFIYHRNWYRTVVTVAGFLSKQRGVNWTKTIPEISMECYGLQDGDLGKIGHAMRYIGIENFDGSWED